MTDLDYMARALALAERGRGAVEPNPLVGAVLVTAGRIVGEGWHERYGQAHAEINALRKAGPEAVGGTLYVTLEPCNHFGKTPPCTDAVLGAGVGRVVAAMLDPFPRVAGQGVAQLRAAGIAVEVGVGEEEARRVNAPYLKLLRAGRPFVHAKWAMTLDGKVATRTGASQWITGTAARQRGHDLRGRVDAIIVGKGTLVADDPRLTARPAGLRTPVRIVLTATAEGMPKTCQLLNSIDDAPVLVFTAEAAVGRLATWRNRGAEIVGLPKTDGESLDVKAVLTELGQRRMTNVLVEGGAGILGSFMDAGEIDEVHAYMAPMMVGGTAAPSPVGGRGVADLAAALRLADWTVERVGDDVLIHGRTLAST